MGDKLNHELLLDRSDLKHFTVMSRLGIMGALGHARKDLDKPWICVANSWSEANPGHVHLRQVAQAVREGILEAGGLPLEINTIAPCDAFSCGLEPMKYVLPQRDLIADDLEMIVRSNSFDGVVYLSTCDKVVPGQLMAAARLRMPALFVTGGPMLPRFLFAPKSVGWNATESAYLRDINTELEETLLEHRAPGPGACTGFGTANTMQCLTEVLGLTLPGMGTTHAVDPNKLRLARESGRQIVRMVREGRNTAAILTGEAFRNAVRALMAMGGSTNAVIHLLAVAHEAGVSLDIGDFDSAGRRVPCVSGVIPSGSYSMLDLHKAGGIPGLLKRIESFLEGEAGNVAGQKLSEVLAHAGIRDEEVIRPLDNPFFPEGAIAILKGNLAPDGAVVKQSAVKKEMLRHRGQARVVNSESEAREALDRGRVVDGDILVIRYEGPKGGPGMREMLGITRHLVYSGKANSVALVTDGRFSGFTSGPAVGHVCPEAQEGGPIGLVVEGDWIAIDIPNRSLTLEVDDRELARRKGAWRPIDRGLTGYLARYAEAVRPANRGAWLGPVRSDETCR